MKQFKILKGVFPLKMYRLANQVVTVCAFLTNFQHALVPVPMQADTVVEDHGCESENDDDCITYAVLYAVMFHYVSHVA